MQSYSKVLVVGLGLSGCAAARFLLKRGYSVCAVDKHMDSLREKKEVQDLLKSGLEVYSEAALLDVHPFDLVVVSPGVPPTHPIYQVCTSLGKEVIGEVELACRFMQHTCLGITGSNGKTTTTLLVEHVLRQAGCKAKAVGNIGKPLTDVLDDQESQGAVLVMELSSWQLETLESRVLEAAVIMNITPNHLDRHKTMEAYAQAKFRIGHCLKPNKPLYVGEAAYQQFGGFSLGKAKTFGFGPQNDIYFKEYTLFDQGKAQFTISEDQRPRAGHDIENIMGAYALCREVGVRPEAFADALFSFKKPPHRIEFVRTYREVSYYDDSKATSIDPVIKAVNSLDGPVVLIAGGVHKGFSYQPWIQGFQQKVRLICVIGEAAGQMQQELAEHIPVKVFLTLEEAVSHASKHAQPGENVLLSPGCASYDMFRDYEQRGRRFKELVLELGENQQVKVLR